MPCRGFYEMLYRRETARAKEAESGLLLSIDIGSRKVAKREVGLAAQATPPANNRACGSAGGKGMPPPNIFDSASNPETGRCLFMLSTSPEHLPKSPAATRAWEFSNRPVLLWRALNGSR